MTTTHDQQATTIGGRPTTSKTPQHQPHSSQPAQGQAADVRMGPHTSVGPATGVQKTATEDGVKQSTTARLQLVTNTRQPNKATQPHMKGVRAMHKGMQGIGMRSVGPHSCRIQTPARGCSARFAARHRRQLPTAGRNPLSTADEHDTCVPVDNNTQHAEVPCLEAPTTSTTPTTHERLCQTSARTALLGARTRVRMAQSTRRRGTLVLPRLSDWPLLTRML